MFIIEIGSDAGIGADVVICLQTNNGVKEWIHLSSEQATELIEKLTEKRDEANQFWKEYGEALKNAALTDNNEDENPF